MSPRPPGFVRPRLNPDVLMMVCTAGHVDHGKTSLVKLLTGCNTDRLKEEQERKLTIELGFAPCALSQDLCVGFVDVPGHEKFVRNMVAGVSGIDMVVLVIAADDGIMPQTIEHFQILEILGVRHGMVALTKIDRVSPERVREVEAQIQEFLTGTFMHGAQICPVSSETFDGLPELYRVLVDEVQSLTKRQSDGVFRMPILNTFVQEGFGNVVTGVPVDGTIANGQPVEVVPGHRKGKIRGLQRFLRDATEGGFGQCLALNVPEFGKEPPERGHVLCLPGYLHAWPTLHLRVHVVAGVQKPLKNAEEVRFHTGTSEHNAKLYLLEGSTLGEGEVGLATVVLSSPVAAAVHDKFIIRRFSPATTVAGGEIIGMDETTRRAPKKRALERLRTYVEFFQDVPRTGDARREREIEYFLRTTQPTGATQVEIARGVLLPSATAEQHVQQLLSAGRVLQFGADRYVHRASYDSFLGEARARIEELAASSEALSVNLAELRKGTDWPASVWNRIQEDLE